MRNFKFLTAQVKYDQICTLIGYFCWEYIKFQLKKYREVMSHNTEEWCKLWRKFTGELCVTQMKNDAKFGQELTCQFKINKFWPKHSKISKICTLMGWFWPKYIMFELKKYRGVMFGDTQDWCKVWRKTA